MIEKAIIWVSYMLLFVVVTGGLVLLKEGYSMWGLYEKEPDVEEKATIPSPTFKGEIDKRISLTNLEFLERKEAIIKRAKISLKKDRG